MKNNQQQQSEEKLELISQSMCMTKDVGVNQNMFGGILLSKFDEAGAIFACRVCDTPRMVTLKISETLFKEPIKVGMIVAIYGSIIHIGNTSISIKLQARKHNPRTGQQELLCVTDMTFVHIDEYGRALPISKKVKDQYAAFTSIK